MRNKLCTALFAMLVALAGPALAQSQKPENNWENLSRLRVGQRVQVVDAKMKKHEGTFLAYATDAITLRTKGGDQGFARDQVLRVSNKEESHRLRNALIGAAVGAGAGLAIGAAADRSFTETGEENTMKKFLTPLTAVGGAAIGASVASFETVYRAPKK